MQLLLINYACIERTISGGVFTEVHQLNTKGSYHSLWIVMSRKGMRQLCLDKEAIGRQGVPALSLFNSGFNKTFRGRVTEPAIAFYRQPFLKTVWGLVFHMSLAACPAYCRRAPTTGISKTVHTGPLGSCNISLNNILMLKRANPLP